AVRATHAEKADDISTYYMSLEIKQVHEGMMIALPPADWHFFRTMSLAEFAAALIAIAEHMDLGYYRKNKRGPKKPPRPKSQYKNGGHVSTHKLLRDKEH
ncbi:MAG TPA: transposase, partial [Gemmataceae bacterium]|nr:transposase [Gemmataceae bacterium]